MTSQSEIKPEEKARWYAFHDPKSKRWKPLFCRPSFSKWTDVEISDEIGDSFSKLRSVECEGVTAAAIEKAVVEKHATLGK